MIYLSGSIDLVTANETTKQITSAMKDCGCVDIDMSSVKFIDSTGISVLLHAVKHAKSATCVKLYNVPISVKRIFHTLGVDRILTIVEDSDADSLPV